MDQQPQPSEQSQTPTTSIPLSSPPRSKKPWLLISIGIVAALLIVTGILVSRHKKPAPITQSVPVTRTVQISITKDGFDPVSLQVPVDTQVTWLNNDETDHQAAADPYPANNSIPGFNSQVVLHKDESYSFNFTKAGTYTYHDEKNPLGLRGTVTVE